MKKTIECRDGTGGKAEPIPVENLVFRPSVYGIIIQDGKVLLSPQWDAYDFPGGGVEKGETLEQALLREVKEETGLTVKKGEIIACEQDFFKNQNYHKGTPYHSILMYFICTNPEGEITTDGFDEFEKDYMKKAEWIDIDKVSTLKFYNGVDSPAIIQKAFNQIHN